MCQDTQMINFQLLRVVVTAGFLTGFLLSPAVVAVENSESLFGKFCISCHTGEESSKAPSIEDLQNLNPLTIVNALKFGKMKEQGDALGEENILPLAVWLAGSTQHAVSAEDSYCRNSGDFGFDQQPIFNGWGYDSNNTRHSPQNIAKISAKSIDKLKLKWAFGVPGGDEMRPQPVITPTTIFLATTTGSVFALSRENGCIKWEYKSIIPFRSALHLGRSPANGKPTLYVTNVSTQVIAIDATTGTLSWASQVGLFPTTLLTGSPIQDGKVLYVPISSYEIMLGADPKYECCKSHGAVSALDAATGDILWTTRMTEPAVRQEPNSVGTQQWGPSGAPVWTTPLIDASRGLLYIGTGENTSSPAGPTSDAIMALDLKSGDVRWVFQALANDAYNVACGGSKPGPSCPKERGPDFDFGASVILTKTSTGNDILLAGQKSGVVHAIDPNSGKLIWQTKLGDGTALGGVHWGMSVGGGKVFVPLNDPEWGIPGYTPRPGVYALRVDNGELLWSAPVSRRCEKPDRPKKGERPKCSYHYGISAAVSSTPELVFSGGLDGMVRIYSTTDGELLWSYDTSRAFDAVNGVDTHGGAIDNTGIVVHDGLMVVPSGYALHSRNPGNALLVFEIGK